MKDAELNQYSLPQPHPPEPIFTPSLSDTLDNLDVMRPLAVSSLLNPPISAADSDLESPRSRTLCASVRATLALS